MKWSKNNIYYSRTVSVSQVSNCQLVLEQAAWMSL